MTPNLFLATQKVFSPHKWFRTPNIERATRKTEYWKGPVPGQYEYIPGRGWYLIATLKDAPTEVISAKNSDESATFSQEKEFVKLAQPIPAVRSQVLGRYLLEEEYKTRKRYGNIRNERGKQIYVGFFQLDDKVAWVQCWDEKGQFISKSEYKRWCIDGETKQFRHLRKGDDPNFEREADNRSQQSASTGYQRGPTSTNDIPSVSSTRASSFRGPISNPASPLSSQAPSRRGSPGRNNSIPLEEAKAALRRMAREHEEAVTAAAAARTRTNSKDAVERMERGRSMMRVAN
jgi:hypothetical protein